MSYLLVCDSCERYTGHSLQEDGHLVCQICGQVGEQLEDTLTLGDQITTQGALELPMKVKHGEDMCVAVLNEVRESFSTPFSEQLESLAGRIYELEKRVSNLFERYNDLKGRMNT